MNELREMKNCRDNLNSEIKLTQLELANFETMLSSAETLQPEKSLEVQDQLNKRQKKLDSLNLQIHLINQKINRDENLLNRKALMEGYIIDIAYWMADELDLKAKQESLSVRLEEVRKQTHESLKNARQSETEAATAYAQAVAWGDTEGEKNANIEANKAAKNLITATEQHRRQQLIIAALESEIDIINQHISKTQQEQIKVEKTAMYLALSIFEDQWNEAAKLLVEAGGRLYATASITNQELPSLLKLDIPTRGDSFESWRYSDIANQARNYTTRELLAI